MNMHELVQMLVDTFKRIDEANIWPLEDSGVVFLSVLADRVMLKYPEMSFDDIGKVIILTLAFAIEGKKSLNAEGLAEGISEFKRSISLRPPEEGRCDDEYDPPDCYKKIVANWNIYHREYPAAEALADFLKRN